MAGRDFFQNERERERALQLWLLLGFHVSGVHQVALVLSVVEARLAAQSGTRRQNEQQIHQACLALRFLAQDQLDVYGTHQKGGTREQTAATRVCAKNQQQLTRACIGSIQHSNDPFNGASEMAPALQASHADKEKQALSLSIPLRH